MPAKKTLRLAKSSKKKVTGKKIGLPKIGKAEAEPAPFVASTKIEVSQQEAPSRIASDSVYVQETPKEQVLAFKGEETKFAFDERERLITTFTAGGVVLSFGLSVGSVIVFPVWGYGGGLLATLGVISCFGAFMARETI